MAWLKVLWILRMCLASSPPQSESVYLFLLIVYLLLYTDNKKTVELFGEQMMHTVITLCLCAWVNMDPRWNALRLDFKEPALSSGSTIFFIFYSYPAKTVESSHTVLRRVFQADSRWLSAQTKHSAAWVSSPAGNKARPRLTSLHACARALHLYPLSPVQQM